MVSSAMLCRKQGDEATYHGATWKCVDVPTCVFCLGALDSNQVMARFPQSFCIYQGDSHLKIYPTCQSQLPWQQTMSKTKQFSLVKKFGAGHQESVGLVYFITPISSKCGHSDGCLSLTHCRWKIAMICLHNHQHVYDVKSLNIPQIYL